MTTKQPKPTHNELTDPKWAEHRRLYPAQYSHPLCGKHVRFASADGTMTGMVTRVMPTQFGLLASIDTLEPHTAIAISALTVIK